MYEAEWQVLPFMDIDVKGISLLADQYTTIANEGIWNFKALFLNLLIMKYPKSPNP